MLKVLNNEYFILIVILFNFSLGFTQENYKYRVDKNCFFENVETLDKIFAEALGKKRMNKKMKIISDKLPNSFLKKDEIVKGIDVVLLFDSNYSIYDVDFIKKGFYFSKREKKKIKKIIYQKINDFEFCFGRPYIHYIDEKDEKEISCIENMRISYENRKEEEYFVIISYPYYLNDYILNQYPFLLN